MSTLSVIEKFFRLPRVTKPAVVRLCPDCRRGEMFVVASEREPIMGELGPRMDTLQCNNPGCGCRETHIHCN